MPRDRQPRDVPRRDISLSPARRLTRRQVAAGLGWSALAAGTGALDLVLAACADGDGPPPAPSPSPTAGPLTVFGAPGSFGGLGDGGPATVVGVPGFGFGPGQAAYMSAVAADGTVFIGTTPFSDDQTRPTGTDLELAVFDPAGRQFTRLVIPTTTGRTSVSSDDPADRGVGGADAADVLVLPDPAGGQRLVFVSAVPFHGWNTTVDGQYPTIGGLRRDSSGTWSYERRLSRTVDELAGLALPNQAAVAYPEVGPASPRSPRGPASIARLPHSGHLVVAQYFGDPQSGVQSGALAVLDLDGRLRAWWQYPPTTPLGIPIVVNPREVVSDPTSEPEDERFVLISDCRDSAQVTQPFPVQEFSYSASAGLITPKSTAIRAVQDGSRMESSCFDAAGNLYVARTKVDGLRADTMAVYPKLGGERTLVRRAPATDDWPASFGIACRPDYLIAGTDRGGLVRSLTVDPATNTILAVGLNGLLQAIRPSGAPGRLTFSTSRQLDIGLDKLRGPATRYVGVRRGAVDAQRRVLWLPLNQLVLDGITWPYPPFKLDQWLARIDLRALLGR